jgi:hypothetical protein
LIKICRGATRTGAAAAECLFLTGSEVIRAFVAAGKFTWTGAAVPADNGKPTANTIQSDRTIVLIDIVNLQFNTHPDQAGRYSSPIITIEHKIMIISASQNYACTGIMT